MTSNSKSPPGANGPYVVTKVLALSATASTTTQFVIDNPGYATGLNVYFRAHSFPGSASTTIAYAIYSIDPATSGTYAMHAPGVAYSGASSLVRFMYGPNLISSGDLTRQVNIGQQYLILLSMSTGATSKDVLFSLGVEWTP